MEPCFITGGTPKVCGGGKYRPNSGFTDVTDKCWEWDHGIVGLPIAQFQNIEI